MNRETLAPAIGHLFITSLMAWFGIYISGIMFLLGGVAKNKVDLPNWHIPAFLTINVILICVSAWFCTIDKRNFRPLYSGMLVLGLVSVIYIKGFARNANDFMHHAYLGIPLGVFVAIIATVYESYQDRPKRKPYSKMTKEHFTP